MAEQRNGVVKKRVICRKLNKRRRWYKATRSISGPDVKDNCRKSMLLTLKERR